MSYSGIPTVAHNCHGKTYFSTAKLTFPRQNLLLHGKTYFSTAKLKIPRQNLFFFFFYLLFLTSGFQSLSVSSFPLFLIRELTALRFNMVDGKEEEDFKF